LPISISIFTYNNIKFHVTTNDINNKNNSLTLKANLEHKWALQESCKTMRRWQIYIMLVNVGQCVGD